MAVPYLLAKFVFTELKYPGWVGLIGVSVIFLDIFHVCRLYQCNSHVS